MMLGRIRKYNRKKRYPSFMRSHKHGWYLWFEKLRLLKRMVSRG